MGASNEVPKTMSKGTVLTDTIGKDVKKNRPF